MSIDTVRKALVELRAFAKGLDCDYQEECTPGQDDMCQSCKHVYIADNALVALSTIDPDAIRRECANKLSDEKYKLNSLKLLIIASATGLRAAGEKQAAAYVMKEMLAIIDNEAVE